MSGYGYNFSEPTQLFVNRRMSRVNMFIVLPFDVIGQYNLRNRIVRVINRICVYRSVWVLFQLNLNCVKYDKYK